MSTYSTNLKIEEIGTGEQAGSWGTTTNENFVNVFEQAIVGRVTVPFADANVTLTATNTVANQSFRNLYLNCTGTNAASRNLVVPTINKNYIVENNTTGGFSIVVKTAAGTGVTIPNGYTCSVYADGTDVVPAFDYIPALIAPPRVVSYANATSITINADTTDIATQTNTQAVGTLTINAPTGNLFNGQKIIIRLQCTNVQTFSWNAAFSGSADLSLPLTTTGSSSYDYMGFIYNSTAAKWQMIAKVFGF
jgi:hypothetical protein